MTLRDQYRLAKEQFIDSVELLFKKFATIFGFPENPGMPVLPAKLYEWDEPLYTDRLPKYTVDFPPGEVPQTLLDVLIGTMPRTITVPRVFYENPNDGYYNFYMLDYKNIYLLPNAVSEFIQIKLKFCLDLSTLEMTREALFFVLIMYYYVINARLFLGFLIIINPYMFPFSYFIAFVDWVDEASTGLLPSFGGTNYAMTILLLVVGKCADALNYIVFTMPFLPAEGRRLEVIIDGEKKYIMLFRHLPYLWYKYPIPNEVRKFWFFERPDILEFMQKSYKNLDINFLPDPTSVTEHLIDKIN